MHKDAAQACAPLPAGSKCREQHAAQRQCKVGRVADDRGVIASKFQDRLGKTRGRNLSDFAAHLRAAGGRDERDARVRDQSRTNVASAMHHL